jgi:essential nuclear protein 1
MFAHIMAIVQMYSLVQHDAGFVTVADGAQGLSPEEEAVVAAMMGGDKQERRTLADIIMEKIQEKESQQAMAGVEEDDDVGYTDIPEKIAEVYTDIGKILSRYTAGKLPKAFKVIPSLTNWEEVLYLTRPDQWTPQAMFAATRIFASNLNPKMAQRFYNLVLLDAVRADIVETQKLNYHYYRCLKKSVYKPAAFFKGILLPLCKTNCTLREAAIVASVLQRVSIPVHHSAVAIHKLSQMEYSGASSIFIKTLLNKKYSLPAPVIGSLVKHFSSFIEDEEAVLPVLWHQSLLVFVQRYKNELNAQTKESFKALMKIHFHHKITPEIRRELFGAQAWKEERAAVLGDAAMQE